MPELPNNQDAERATLGACLLNRDAVIRANAIVKPADFYAERHAIIWQAVTGCYERRIPPDVQTVATALMRAQQLDSIGGVGYLSDLTDSAPTSYHVEYYAAEVARTARLRALITIGGRIAQIGYNGDDDGAAYQEAQALLTGGMTQRQQSLLVPLAAVLDDLFTELGTVADPAVRTGIHDYDELTGGGLWPGELIVPAGRAGHGKSSWVGTLTANVATAGHRVHFFGLEMQRKEVARRLLSSNSGVDTMALRKRKLSDADFQGVAASISQMSEWPVMLAEARVTMSEVRTAVLRDIAENGPVALIVVDYIQLIKPTPGRKGGTRDQELGEITRELKDLSQEAKCTVMAPSQLNRDIERRGSNSWIPTLADLRESGNIENDADGIDFVVNPAMFDLKSVSIDEKSYPSENLGVLIRKKGRNTGGGMLPLFFDAKHATFRDMEKFRAVEGY